MSKGGRPSQFTKDLALEICGDISTGMSLRRSCENRDLAPSTVVGWFMDPEKGVSEHYERARRIAAELMYDELLDIADDGQNDWMEVFGRDGEMLGWKENPETINRSKHRTDIRKWILARKDPKRYSDRQKIEHTGSEGGPISIELIRGTPPSEGSDES